MTDHLNGQKILIIGGGSGIGLATAALAHEVGAKVVIAGRSLEKLAVSAKSIGDDVQFEQVDIADEASTAQLFRKIGVVDHLAITGPAPGFQPFRELSAEAAKEQVEGKFWGQYRAAYHAVAAGLPESGSITFMSGAYSARPVPGASLIAAVQSGIEGLARGLAVDLSPIRVNAVSPGLTDTPLIRGIFGDTASEQLFSETAQSLPAKRVATPQDIAEVYLFLMSNRTMTGATLFADSGYTLR